MILLDVHIDSTWAVLFLDFMLFNKKKDNNQQMNMENLLKYKVLRLGTVSILSYKTRKILLDSIEDRYYLLYWKPYSLKGI